MLRKAVGSSASVDRRTLRRLLPVPIPCFHEGWQCRSAQPLATGSAKTRCIEHFRRLHQFRSAHCERRIFLQLERSTQVMLRDECEPWTIRSEAAD